MPPLNFLLALFGFMILSLAFSLQYLLFTTIPAPLEAMFNASFIKHYGSALDTLGLSTIWSIASFTQKFGELVGIATLLLIDRKGRKFISIHFRYYMIIVSGILLLLAYFLPSFECFVIACAINGAGIQVKIAAVGIYVSECAPKDYRGFAVVMLALGDIVGSIVSMTLLRPSFFGNVDLWYLFPIIAMGLSTAAMLFMHWLPESPQFLLNKGKLVEAERAVEFYNGKRNDCEHVLALMQKQHKVETKQVGYMQVLRDESQRKILILLVAIMLFMDVSPVSMDLMFTVKLHTILGFDAETIMSIMTLQRLVIIPFFFPSSVAIEKIGRRPIAIGCYTLIWVKACVMALGLFIEFTSGASTITQITAVLSDTITTIIICLGIGQMQMLFLCELTPPSSRVSMVQLTSGISMGVGVIFASLVPFALSYFPPMPFLFFILFQPFLIHHIYKNLPETAGRELYEIVEDFEEAVRSRAPTRRTTIIDDDEYTPLLPQ